MLAYKAPGPETPIQKCTPKPPDSLFHSTRGRCWESAGLIHASIVSPLPVPTLRLADPVILMLPVRPSKLKARPTRPRVNVTPPRKVPGLRPITSVASPSLAHQLTNPVGRLTQILVT